MVMKCTKCGRPSGKSKWCSGCKREWALNNAERVRASQQAYVHRFKAERDTLKNRPCADCRKRYHPRLMDFDHRRAHTKRHTIGRMQGNLSAMRREIAKCDLVCVMCHRARTHARRLKQRAPQQPMRTYRKRQDLIASAKNAPCAICGRKFPSWQMDLDHLRDKTIDLAAASRRLNLKEIQLEIEKCRVLCALDHRAVTYGVSAEPLAA